MQPPLIWLVAAAMVGDDWIWKLQLQAEQRTSVKWRCWWVRLVSLVSSGCFSGATSEKKMEEIFKKMHRYSSTRFLIHALHTVYKRGPQEQLCLWSPHETAFHEYAAFLGLGQCVRASVHIHVGVCVWHMLVQQWNQIRSGVIQMFKVHFNMTEWWKTLSVVIHYTICAVLSNCKHNSTSQEHLCDIQLCIWLCSCYCWKTAPHNWRPHLTCDNAQSNSRHPNRTVSQTARDTQISDSYAEQWRRTPFRETNVEVKSLAEPF